MVGSQLARRASFEAALVVTAPLLLLVVRYFSWGAGVARLGTFGVLFGFVALVTRRRAYLLSVCESKRGQLVLASLALLLFALHVRLFVIDIARGGECLTDMGRPTICAGEWLRRGLNPWAHCVSRATRQAATPSPDDTWSLCMQGAPCIDPRGGHAYPNWTHHGPGFDFMDGYKYGPLMALSYAPFVHSLRERGLFGVNFAFWLAQCALLWLLARAAYPTLGTAPPRAWLGWLLPLVVPTAALFPTQQIWSLGASHELSAPEPNTFVLELTYRCSNDIVPVVLGLCALLWAARGRSAAAGIWLGLSLASKQLPGLLLCLLLPRLQGVRARPLLLATLVTTSVCYLPFFVWAPREMIANLLLFSALRPTNSSSIRAYLPASFESVIAAAQLLSALLIALHFAKYTRRDLAALLRAATLMCISFVALNKVVHGNYLLWLQPLLALTLAGLPFRAAAEAPPPTPLPAR